jgi:8-oxo-dGTP diphosphatase
MPNDTPLSAYDRPSVAVDLVLMTVADGALRVLLQRHESLGWVLPGGIVRVEEPLEATVARVLAEKARLPGAFVEQLYTFGAIGRDPRGRVISVAYYALVPAERLAGALQQSPDLTLAAVLKGRPQAPGGLGYDHPEIVRVAAERLAAKLDYTAIALELLPDEFTLRALQDVYETILDVRLAKPAFRRKMLDRGFLKSTGRFETGGAHRPAELYVRA